MSEIGLYMRRYATAASMPPAKQRLVENGWWSGDRTVGAVGGIRSSVYNAMLSKIPAGVTRVLDIGCGGGDFATVLHAARPGVVYRGIDLSLEAIAAATASLQVDGNLPANVELEAGNVWEYLHTATVEWDFIISSLCLFDESPRSGDRDLLRLIDSKAPKGWFLYGKEHRLRRPDLQHVMTQALAQSTDATEHYFEGNQSFLSGDLLVDPEADYPVYLVRGATVAPVPDSARVKSFEIIGNGRYEAERAQETLRSNGSMTQYTGITQSGGRITGQATVPKANAPVKADLEGVEARQARKHTVNATKG